jgi:hypothetical protein
VKRLVFAAVQHPWVLDYAVPIGQIVVGITWRRMSRRRRLNRGDLAIGTDLFLTALAVWLAVLAAINLAIHDRLQQANLELAWQVLVPDHSRLRCLTTRCASVVA